MPSSGNYIGRGTLAARPAAGTAGRLYYVTDDSTLYRDSGSAWESVGEATGAGGAYDTLVVDQSGASHAGWTAGTGTWASDGSVIKQTATTTATHFRTAFNTAVAFGRPWVYQAEVRIDAVQGTSNQYAGIHLLSSGGATAGGPMAVMDDVASAGSIQTGNSGQTIVLLLTAVIDIGTWYTLRMSLSGNVLTVWRDGIFIGNAIHTPSRGGDLAGLICYNTQSSFRNIKLWVPSTPA